MKTNYAGLDYSLGKSNFNPETGIHFGIIPLHACNEFAFDEFEPNYGDPHCPKCGDPAIESAYGKDYFCDHCYSKYHDEPADECTDDLEAYCHYSENCFGDSPDSYELEDGEYKASFDPDSNDIWIFNSPYYTHAQFCSPCAPGAGYLLNPCDNGPKTYCLGHDWFEGNKAPYTIYLVADNSIVEPKE